MSVLRPGVIKQHKANQTNRCIVLLLAPPLPPDVLGPLQQNTVMTAVQLVVCLAICPNLLPGVGSTVDFTLWFCEFSHWSSIAVDGKANTTVTVLQGNHCFVVCKYLKSKSRRSMHWDTYKQHNYSTVGGDGGCRVGDVRAGTTSSMPDHKGFKQQ